eukprot:3855533-Rhodomonas_salina.5
MLAFSSAVTCVVLRQQKYQRSTPTCKGQGFRVQGSGFMFKASGFMVEASGLRVRSAPPPRRRCS